ncbi:hypothetical protein CAEBREN_12883 [Caenorhabditis brenneri]|uniref:Ubiquitin-like protease family profile domain-containing protein n=1 Tax=Caenorhabditis brenneri TaxID=135651 RepID=G0N7W9_CAEBE|nr:hypothetical protein CAEBREN_12883 [Caenorhabditis brenneri]
MKLRGQPSDREEEVGKDNKEKEKKDEESSDDEPKPKKVCVNGQELPEINVNEIACLNISLEEIENFAKSSETAATLFASLMDGSMTGLSNKTKMLSNAVLTITLFQIVRNYNILHPDCPVALFDFDMAMSEKEDLEGRMYFNEEGNCRRFILPVHTERREEDGATDQEHYALIYMDKADDGHVMYADSFRLFKLPDERIKNIAKVLGMPNAAVERMVRERVQHQTLKNSCGVHVAANCFAFLEHGIQFPRIRVNATNIRQQIVKFIRGVKYVKQKYSIKFGVQINWNKQKPIKVPKEFEVEELIEGNEGEPVECEDTGDMNKTDGSKVTDGNSEQSTSNS